MTRRVLAIMIDMDSLFIEAFSFKLSSFIYSHFLRDNNFKKSCCLRAL